MWWWGGGWGVEEGWEIIIEKMCLWKKTNKEVRKMRSINQRDRVYHVMIEIPSFFVFKHSEMRKHPHECVVPKN